MVVGLLQQGPLALHNNKLVIINRIKSQNHKLVTNHRIKVYNNKIEVDEVEYTILEWPITKSNYKTMKF